MFKTLFGEENFLFISAQISGDHFVISSPQKNLISPHRGAIEAKKPKKATNQTPLFYRFGKINNNSMPWLLWVIAQKWMHIFLITFDVNFQVDNFTSDDPISQCRHEHFRDPAKDININDGHRKFKPKQENYHCLGDLVGYKYQR